MKHSCVTKNKKHPAEATEVRLWNYLTNYVTHMFRFGGGGCWLYGAGLVTSHTCHENDSVRSIYGSSQQLPEKTSQQRRTHLMKILLYFSVQDGNLVNSNGRERHLKQLALPIFLFGFLAHMLIFASSFLFATWAFPSTSFLHAASLNILPFFFTVQLFLIFSPCQPAPDV